MSHGIRSSAGKAGASFSGTELKTSVSSAPFLLVTAVAFTLLTAMVPATSWIAVFVPLLLLPAMTSNKPLLAACFLGNLLMLFGSTGEVEFLGRLTIDVSTTSSAVIFSNVLSMSIFLGTRIFCREVDGGQQSTPIPVLLNVGILSLAVVLLLVRFANGVPILLGDNARLNGLLATNPYLGLFSGLVPIAAAFLKSDKSRLIWVLRIIVVVLVAGTASRLLLGAVLVGFVSSSRLFRTSASFKGRVYLLATGIVALLAVTRIYAARTAEGIQQVYEYRVSNIGGITGWVTDLIGPSIFYAARNGLVIFEIVTDAGLRPPHGFIVGGLYHVLNIGIDPEIWLTTAIGFNVVSVGAIATPIWAGAAADFGMLGACVMAVTVGLVFSLALSKVRELEYWFAFGILLSFYGSYFVSSQFVGASLLIFAIVRVSHNRNRIVPSSSRRSASGITRSLKDN